MAAAYEESLTLGQLAVSYVLDAYTTGQSGFREPAKELRDFEHKTLDGLVQGLTVEEEMRQQARTEVSVRKARARLYVRLGVGKGAMAAVRRCIEEGVLQVGVRPRHEAPTPDLLPYELVSFDLASRGCTNNEISKLTGYSSSSIGEQHIGAVLKDMKVPGRRKSLAVMRMYKRNVFQVGYGLLSSLELFPDIIERFDSQLGRSRPFINDLPEFVPSANAEQG